jgi:CRP/FNR family transcriptional regulator, anaerobic regulatory protein
MLMPSFLNMILDQNLWDKKQVFAKGDLISREGYIDSNIYFVKEGALKLYILDGPDEHIIRFAYKGDFAISIDTFFSQKPSMLYVEALKKSTVYSISRTKFLSIIDGQDAYKKEWTSVLEHLLFQQFEREVDLRISSPEKRYHRVLQRSPNLFQLIPLKYIANYLRMAPETLSRLRKS